MTEMKFQ